jgi:hypothetical protein
MAIYALWRQVRFHCSFLRNMAAVLAGTNSMSQHSFYFASGTAAAAWIIGFGLAAYSFGEAFANVASPAAIVLGLAAALIISAAPVLILRYERRLLAKAERALPRRGADIRCYSGSSHNASANTASVSARFGVNAPSH